MALDELLGSVWDDDIDEEDIEAETGCIIVEVIEVGAAVFNDFCPGRARVWLNEDDTVWKIEADYHDGTTTRASH